MAHENPFEVTKAVDFTDAEIKATWVDLPGGGFASIAPPLSPMPRFLVGGKGGGRTHLLRYYSYALQRLRHVEDPFAGIQQDGYIGLYFRCTGLNSGRFSGKGQTDEAWQAVFAYATDLWMAERTISVVKDYVWSGPNPPEESQIEHYVSEVASLFDVPLPDVAGTESGSLAWLQASVGDLQRRLDHAVNNAAITRSLELEVTSSPGRTVFGIPQAAARAFPAISNFSFAYLIDEFENLTSSQQRYFNTLLREKQLPTTFLFGSRLFGLKSHLTLSADEENRQGSEFELVLLEDTYRTRTKDYGRFCEDIVRRRLREAGLSAAENEDLRLHFEEPGQPKATLEDRARSAAFEAEEQLVRRPWLERLANQLNQAGNDDPMSLISALEVPESPLHEKFGLLLFYRRWARGDDLAVAAHEAGRSALSLAVGERVDAKVRTSYQHFRADLYVQLIVALGRQVEYQGLDTFIQMSGYLPRNLLIVLKRVTRWSLFLGEAPFRGTQISSRAQSEGVREASDWFLKDAPGLGPDGEHAQTSIRRLGAYLRTMRFSDKPVEPACATFSTDRKGLSETALSCLDHAISHSLLLEVSTGRQDKNARTQSAKYQLNPMLAPQFNLPLVVRGAASLSSQVLNSIFDPMVDSAEFNSLRRKRADELSAPFGSSAPQRLFGLEE